MQFSLTNNFEADILFSLEPDGTIIKLIKGNTIIIEVLGDQQPLINLTLSKDDEGLYFQVWPENGDYRILS